MTSIDSIFFGIMVGDLFGDEDVDGIDADASVSRYAEQITVALKGEYGDSVEVDWSSQNVGGSIPSGLQTKVNGEIDHDEIPFVDDIIGKVWQEWDWVVYKS